MENLILRLTNCDIISAMIETFLDGIPPYGDEPLSRRRLFLGGAAVAAAMVAVIGTANIILREDKKPPTPTPELTPIGLTAQERTQAARQLKDMQTIVFQSMQPTLHTTIYDTMAQATDKNLAEFLATHRKQIEHGIEWKVSLGPDAENSVDAQIAAYYEPDGSLSKYWVGTTASHVKSLQPLFDVTHPTNFQRDNLEAAMKAIYNIPQNFLWFEAQPSLAEQDTQSRAIYGAVVNEDGSKIEARINTLGYAEFMITQPTYTPYKGR